MFELRLNVEKTGNQMQSQAIIEMTIHNIYND